MRKDSVSAGSLLKDVLQATRQSRSPFINAFIKGARAEQEKCEWDRPCCPLVRFSNSNGILCQRMHPENSLQVPGPLLDHHLLLREVSAVVVVLARDAA